MPLIERWPVYPVKGGNGFSSARFVCSDWWELISRLSSTSMVLFWPSVSLDGNESRSWSSSSLCPSNRYCSVGPAWAWLQHGLISKLSTSVSFCALIVNEQNFILPSQLRIMNVLNKRSAAVTSCSAVTWTRSGSLSSTFSTHMVVPECVGHLKGGVRRRDIISIILGTTIARDPVTEYKYLYSLPHYSLIELLPIPKFYCSVLNANGNGLFLIRSICAERMKRFCPKPTSFAANREMCVE